MTKIHRSIIKEIRKRRGISQKDLGHAIGSQSMVSRIESSQTEPNDYTVFLLCRFLNISFDEYFEAVFGFQESDNDKLHDRLIRCYVYENRQEIDTLIDFYSGQAAKHPRDQTVFHRLAMAEGAWSRLTLKPSKTAKRHLLTDYFFSVSEWHYYDLRLLAWVTALLDGKQLKIYVFQIVYEKQFFKKSGKTKSIIEDMIISSLCVAIVRRDAPMSSYLIAASRYWQESEKTSFDYRTWVLFLNGIYENKFKNKAAGRRKINQAYRIVTYLKSDSTTILFDRLLRKMNLSHL